MGGIFLDDLMADVNVLIVGDYDTEKYKFCAKRRHDIKFIKADAIYSIYSEWREGREFDSSVIDQHLCSVFEGLSICLSRISNADDDIYNKNYISTLIKEFKGTPTDSLLMSTSFVITTEQRGKRFEKALEWGIPVVHPKWVLDSAMRGAIMEHKYYDIGKVSEDEMGKDACLIWDQLADRKEDLYSLDNRLYQESKKIPGGRASHGKNVLNNDLFSGLCFLTYGFAESQMEKLSEVIKEKGGEIVQDYDSSVTHLLIPSTMAFRSVPGRFKDLIETKDLAIVNEWLLDRSLFYKQLKFDSWSIPRNYCNLDFGLRISVSGFSGVELLHITKLIDLLGCQFIETFQKDCDFLLVNLSTIGLNRSNSPKLFNYKYSDILSSRAPVNTSNKSTKDKINAAKKWDIPVLSLAYIWQISEEGILPNIMDYEWCIFGPRSAKPAHNYMEYAREVSKGTFETPKKPVTEDNDNSLPVEVPSRLPSPRKPKNKKWPRLIGTASESQLKTASRQLPQFGETHSLLRTRRAKKIGSILDEEDRIPEIGYDVQERRHSKRRKNR
ncbi:DEKNAAC103020 [Brettanomyces naardenensis]|uniref:DEKNAAC103020 n=1 Tax=Brettanomyces naardenensis TaxID=13370 RepID=A0A448YMD8_BRENA|nr:DEKNAAC103020 [Brettanomyces naardenensis]